MRALFLPDSLVKRDESAAGGRQRADGTIRCCSMLFKIRHLVTLSNLKAATLGPLLSLRAVPLTPWDNSGAGTTAVAFTRALAAPPLGPAGQAYATAKRIFEEQYLENAIKAVLYARTGRH